MTDVPPNQLAAMPAATTCIVPRSSATETQDQPKAVTSHSASKSQALRLTKAVDGCDVPGPMQLDDDDDFETDLS
ncbi:hypothetical protein PG996_013330 [Apiospora saccharicola]|uniref:Uncharacterized protein n=1 Tax=Apiospora saccharicola TaxID=335842 RepID=A0ABR1U550_9PEZI